MAWRRIGDKPLSEPMLTRFTDAYMPHCGAYILLIGSWRKALVSIIVHFYWATIKSMHSSFDISLQKMTWCTTNSTVAGMFQLDHYVLKGNIIHRSYVGCCIRSWYVTVDLCHHKDCRCHCTISWLGVGLFSKVVATFNHVGEPFNLLMSE